MALKEVCSHRVLRQMIQTTIQAIEASSGGNAFCALVTDEDTLRVISSCSQVYDCLDSGVAVIELISKSRQALPQLDAIYFLSPTQESMAALHRDFKIEKKPQYRSAFVFWSSTIMQNPQIMSIIAKESGFLSRLKSFVDFNMHFVAHEARAFHIDMPTAITSLFPTTHEMNEPLLREIAIRLATACISLGDLPNVRFHSSNRKLSERVATMVNDYMSQVHAEGVSRGQSELVILDRSIDPCGLLVHEYTYQALAYDVLNVPCCTPREIREKAGEDLPPDDTYQFLDRKEVQTLVFGEHDEIWVRYRHQHIMTVSRGVAEELRKFSKDNAAAQYAAAGGKRATDKDIAGAIRGLPEYKEMLSKFWAHITVAESCFAALTQQGIFKAGGLEQDLATGVDKEGKLVQVMNCLQSLGTLVAEKSGILTAEKVRLLLMYFVSMDGVQEDDKKKMMGAAGLSLDMTGIINNFLSLGLHLNDDSNATSMTGSLKHTHKMHLEPNKEKAAYYQRRAKDSDYELSRYEPALKELMDRSAAGSLNRVRFPFVVEPTTQAGRMGGMQGQEESGRAGRIRAARFDWDWGTADASTSTQNRRGSGFHNAPAESLAATVLQPGKKRIIFFVLGGMTFAEIRSAYDVSKATGADIYIGSTSILSCPALFELLKRRNQVEPTAPVGRFEL